MLLESAANEFLLACEADGLSKSTLSWYSSLVGAFQRAHTGRLLNQVTANDVRRYLVAVRRQYDNADTVSAHNRALHRFWSWAAAEYSIPNPMRNIRYPDKPQPKPRAANLEDIRAMFTATGEGLAGTRDRAILAFLLDTGARAAGLCDLFASDLDIENRRAIVTEKGNKTRSLVFSSHTAKLLSEWLAVRSPVTWVFYNLDTLFPLTPSGLYQALRRLAKRAGVKGRFNPHSLRHTFAKEYILAGGDLATLSRILGHRDVSTTVAHYTVFTDKDIREKHDQYSPVGKLFEKDHE